VPSAFRLFTPGVVLVPGSASTAAGTQRRAPQAGSEFPPLPPDSRYPDRVLPQIHPVATGERAFSATHPDGSPIRFDPCRPLHWALNPEGMPEGGEQMLRESVAEISAATGLAFAYDGSTTERVDEDREPVQPQRYGERWAPVLVDWVDNAEVAYPDEEVFGVTSRYSVAPSGSPDSARYTTGWVGLNRAWFTESLADPARAAVARGVVLHELGHLVGLDHVEDPAQVMHATSETTGLADGDREGLAIAGAGPCYGDT
jgi:Matrixin